MVETGYFRVDLNVKTFFNCSLNIRQYIDVSAFVVHIHAGMHFFLEYCDVFHTAQAKLLLCTIIIHHTPCAFICLGSVFPFTPVKVKRVKSLS